ncbi:MAG: ABC transporter ATP-binding protein [Acidobacteria bacterium]|nr:ABC transporter ATP-binding protein [Acidobacteriota bacterium]
MSAVLRATHLSKRFRSLTVLNDLDLEVTESSVYGLIGPNGAGKTTTIKVLMNIHKPTSGHTEVLGVDSRALGPANFAEIGYVSENQQVPDWMTVDHLLAYLKPFYPRWDEARAEQLLRQFNIPRSQKLKHLSRGMLMRTALISSLAYHPRLLILDEPFSGLDPVAREDLIEGIVESASESTVFISSHDLGDIESFATHIGYLDDGRLQFSEEMASLTARFREVEVTMAPPAVLPAGQQWPATWLRPETTPAVVRFVDTHFEPVRTTTEIRRLFGEVRQISVNPMPLRSIFLALARSASKSA